MVTVKNLYPLIITPQNAEDAYRKASSCKRYDRDYLIFELNRYYNLNNIVESLENKTYHIGEYEYFTVFEPKKREIMKLPVTDRIVQHMWNNYVTPTIDNRLFFHSYACRTDKGLHVASEVLQGWLYKEVVINKRKVWAIKGDLKSYFKSIDHEILKFEMRKYISDKDTLWLTDMFIDNNGLLPDGVGIPVGNLSSQLFANIYGNILDTFIKHVLHIPYYIRYMDDFIILGFDYHQLEEILGIINQFVQQNMRMSLNPSTTILYAENGIDFIGFRHFPEYTVPRKETIRKLDIFVAQYINDMIPEEEFVQSLQSRLGHIMHCDTHQLIQSVYRELYISNHTDEELDLIS